MSVIVEEEATCPHCGAAQVVKVARSVNGGRSPQLRQAVIDGVFQRPACGRCGRGFVVESTFSYVDFSRQHLIVCHPIGAEPEWRRHEAELQELVAREFTFSEVAEARALGDGLVTRLVFGLDALREKLLCFDSGLDDRLLEVVKVLALGSDARLRSGGDARPRLVAVDDQTLRLATTDAEIVIDRHEYDSIAGPEGRWTVWLARLDGPYVDLARIVGPGARMAN